MAFRAATALREASDGLVRPPVIIAQGWFGPRPSALPLFCGRWCRPGREHACPRPRAEPDGAPQHGPSRSGRAPAERVPNGSRFVTPDAPFSDRPRPRTPATQPTALTVLPAVCRAQRPTSFLAASAAPAALSQALQHGTARLSLHNAFGSLGRDYHEVP